MLHSKRSHEGYLLIDHTAGDGMDSLGQRPAVPGGRKLESATITCSHCQRVVVLNPDRSRSRGYCPKCDHFICDDCEIVRVASGGACKPFKQVIDEHLESVVKRQARDPGVAAPSIILP